MADIFYSAQHDMILDMNKCEGQGQPHEHDVTDEVLMAAVEYLLINGDTQVTTEEEGVLRLTID